VKEANSSSPESVVNNLVHALNTGRVEQALSLVVEDVVVILITPPPGTSGVFLGKAALRKRYEQYVAEHEFTNLSNFEVHGNLAGWSASLSADAFRALGIAALYSRAHGVLQDGLLKTYTWVITDKSLALLESPLAKNG
jgi:hypothetical protein